MCGTIKKLWREYLAEESATMDDEERELTKTAARLHEEMNSLLSKEAHMRVEEYLNNMYELSSLIEEKAFIKGCEFAISFLLEAGGFEIAPPSSKAV